MNTQNTQAQDNSYLQRQIVKLEKIASICVVPIAQKLYVK